MNVGVTCGLEVVTIGEAEVKVVDVVTAGAVALETESGEVRPEVDGPDSFFGVFAPRSFLTTPDSLPGFPGFAVAATRLLFGKQQAGTSDGSRAIDAPGMGCT